MKAFLEEAGSDAVIGLLREATTRATSRHSFVECHAAFARGRREGRLSPAQASRAARGFDRRWADLVVVELDAVGAERAAELARSHPLRSADAIHLAAAHELVDDPAELTFACWDRRLWEAARTEGFLAAPSQAP